MLTGLLPIASSFRDHLHPTNARVGPAPDTFAEANKNLLIASCHLSPITCHHVMPCVRLHPLLLGYCPGH